MASAPTNNDVVTEILLHLPLRSLLRFRTVCKFWHDVIDSEHFRNSHIHHHANNNDNDDDTIQLLRFRHYQEGDSDSLILLLDARESQGEPQALRQFLNNCLKPHRPITAPGCIVKEPFRHVRVSGPVNGLVCIFHDTTLADMNMAVCNPSLGQIMELPARRTHKCFSNHRQDVAISFVIGRDYKVVELISCFDDNSMHGFVYSRTTNSWRDLPVPGELLSIAASIKSLSRNGGVAWWRAWRFAGEAYEDVIVSLDMKNESFRTFNMPEYASLTRFGQDKIFAKGNKLVLIISDTYGFKKTKRDNWLSIYESRFEGNDTVRWVRVRKAGPFGGVVAKGLWRSGCVVLHHFSTKYEVIFYDYYHDKIVRRFEMPYPDISLKIIEYRGSFVSP